MENTITGHSYKQFVTAHIYFGSEGSIGLSVECDFSIYYNVTGCIIS
jgi:hypothetical protein